MRVKGWLKENIDDACAEVATWHQGLRGSPDSAIDNDALLGGIKKLKERLVELSAEADKRNLVY